MTARRPSVAELFDRALDLGPAERRALLDAECAGDPSLRKEVEALLAADGGEAAAAIEKLTPHRGVELQPGDLVAGRYRIVRWLGQGGMGTVYEAEQLQPQRRVALKCLRAGPANAAALRRFHREAELLGQLRDPGIAQILEAGFIGGSEEQPFFAMEYVQGPSLLDHARTLALPEQLELFAQVCDAVQHAHALGIVHRDLKPANVLVDTGMTPPRPKVLDFGVSRMAGQGQATMLTGTHEIVGTLAYLSPEQVTAGSATVDARSDVWSLGVTLYQLLAGRLPLDLTGRSLPQAARVLEDEEPTRLERLVTSLRGDVATIVHKALSKEPGRRYANAGELAADLRRYLRSEPIAARPTSALYQWHRFARRHRALVGGIAATFVALVVGLAVSLHFLAGEREQRGIAERRADEVQAVTRDLILDVDAELAKVSGSTEARRKLVASGLRYAESLLQEAGDDPRYLTDVGIAFLKLAKVLGDPARPNLGDVPGAEAALRKATSALQRASELAPDPRPALAWLEDCRNLEGELLRIQDQKAAAAAAQQQAREVGQRMAAEGDREGAELNEAMAAANRGRAQAEAGQHAEAVASFEIYLASQRKRIGTDDPVAATNAAMILGYIAESRRRLGDGPGCRKALEEALAIAETFQHEHPDDAGGRRAVIQALRGLAIDETLAHRPAAALPLLERAREQLAAAPPEAADVATVRLQAIVDYDVATALIALDRCNQAQPVLAAYQERIADLLRRTPQSRPRARDAMLGKQLAARMYGRLRDREALEQNLAAALAACRAATAVAGSVELAWEDLDETQRIGARAWADLLQTAKAEDTAALRQRILSLFEEETATMAKMAELGYGKSWLPARQQQVATLLADLRAGKDVDFDH